MRFNFAIGWKRTRSFWLVAGAIVVGLLLTARPGCAQIWNARFPSGNSGEYFQSIASSTNGSTLVVVSSDSANTASSIGQIFVSTNFGVNWRTAAAPINWWTSVACSANGTKMVASAINPSHSALAGIYTSSDSGATWQQSAASPKVGTGGPFSSAGAIASSADGTKVILAAGGIFLSTDSGATWQPTVITNGMTGVASSADGTNLVAVGYGTNAGVIYHSGDSGATWSSFTLPAGFTNAASSVASSADGRKLVAAGYWIYTSTNYGATWQKQSGAPSGWSQAGYWATVASSGDGASLVVGGQLGTREVCTSLDSGVTWVSNNIPSLSALPWFSVAISADGKKVAAVPMATGIGIFTASLDGLGESLAATPTRVDLQDQIEVTMTVHNGTTNTLTDVQVDGAITKSGAGGVSFTGFSGPSVVLSLPPGTNAILTYEYTATNYGVVTFSATAVGQGPEGAVYGIPATSGKVAIYPTCDLMVKTTAKDDTNFLGVGEFQQPPPYNDQKLNLAIGTNGAAAYVMRMQNGSRVAHTFVLRAQTNPDFPNWNIQVLANSANILDALTGPDGWTTPSLAPGATFDLQVSLSPMANAGLSDRPFVGIGAFPDSTTIDYALDAVQLSALLVPVPIEGSLYALNANGLTADSIAAGNNDINALLVPVTDPTILAAQSLIHAGLVADGVTPLLIQLTADPSALAQYPQGVQFSIQPTIGGGTLNGDPIGQRFQVLQNGAWQPLTPADSFTLTATNNVGYLELLPISSDDVRLRGANQLSVDLSVVDTGSSSQCGDIQFTICKPPIALLHGYNTSGDWGDEFKSILGASRPYYPQAPNDNFVVTVKYLQDIVTNGLLSRIQAYKGMPVYENTVARLDVSARAALDQLTSAMAPLHDQWAFTRFDVVAHSQGGVLARMLCNANFNDYVNQPFRNADNFNRGRFHRVVTIGSPHNGTRLLHYLLVLNNSPNPITLPQIVGKLGVFSQIAQEKFDPWGPQFMEVNDPSPSADWYPDPAPIFHLVRPTIDYGTSPGFGDLTPSYLALGLGGPDGGSSVIPRGSDGVVDFDSMGANVPPASVAANVYTVPPVNLISHAGPTQLFGSTSVETESTVIAQHVVDALDQNPFVSPANIIFDRFPLPSILDLSQKQAIDDYAASITFQTFSNLLQALPQPHVAGASSYPYHLLFPTNLPPQGNVVWFVQVYGPAGITSDGVELSESGTNNSQVIVIVDNGVVGDVVLSATYQSASNTIVVIPPTLVVSMQPAGVTLTGIQVLPANIALPPGSTISPQVVANYSDGSSSLRYVTADALKVVSSRPATVSVSDPLNWQFSAVGTAQVTLTWSGFNAVSQLTVFDPSGNTSPPLSLVRSGIGQLTYSWPGFTTSYQLESSADLKGTNGWHPVAATPFSAAGQSFVTLPMTNAQQFYRLKLLP